MSFAGLLDSLTLKQEELSSYEIHYDRTPYPEKMTHFLTKLTAMKTALRYVTLLMLTVFAWVAGSKLYAQVTQEAIRFERPNLVNFHDLSEYEKNHPVILARRFIEQGEDREKFVFRPKPVRSDAITRNVPRQAPAQGQAATNSPSSSQNFQGILDNGTLIPPDINGAVGTNYVIETTNQQFNIYTKSTGALVSTVTISTLFSPSGLANYYDPHIVYDPNNNRFIIGIDAQTGTSSTAPSAFAVAVSQTGDPTGNWYIYHLTTTPSAPSDFMDYDQLGFNNTWIVQTGNDFPAVGNNKSYIYVWPIQTLYAGGSGTATTFTDLTNLLLSPAATYDASQNTEYMVSDYNGNSGGNGYVNIGTITGTATAPLYTAGQQLGINQPWQDPSALEDAPQLGETATRGLEAGDTRIHSVIYRNGSLWFTHTVFLPASGTIKNAAIDWWQINPSALTVTQFDRIADPNSLIWYYYPSLDVNANGDMLIGYSASSSTTYGGAQYALRMSSDPVNTLETPVQFVNGLAGYYKTYGGGRNRWGDFSGTAFDPVDNSFWTFQEWANTGSNWGTQIAHVPNTGTATCTTPTGMTTSAIGNNSATFNWTAVSGATGYNVQYRIIGTTTWSTGSTNTNSFVATSLTAGSNYEWQVQTVCSATSTSAFTVSTNFTTTGGCATPTGLSVSNITNTSATLGWTAVSGANSYTLGWKLSSSPTYTTVSVTTGNSYALGSLTQGTKYDFEVQAVCTAGSSGESLVDSFTTTAPCTAPTNLNVSTITSTSASLGWTAVGSASSYTLQWRDSTTAAFTTVTGVASNSYALSGLTANHKYYFQVESICSGSNSGYSTLDSFKTSSTTITYCASKGNTTYEYIKTVALGTINHTTTNDGGYGNFTSLSTNLTAGSTYTVTLTPGFTGSSYTEYWTVYIDYNQNGTLNNSGEIVATGNGRSTVTKTFVVPTSALNGPTRMRIQLHYGSSSTNPCATLNYGDVQDFTVNITGGAATPVIDNSIAADVDDRNIDAEARNTLLIFPNPSRGMSPTAAYNLAKDGNATLKVVDVNGKLLRTIPLGLQSAGAHNYLIDRIGGLSAGYYFIILEQNNQVIARNRFIVTHS